VTSDIYPCDRDRKIGGGGVKRCKHDSKTKKKGGASHHISFFCFIRTPRKNLKSVA
jgi:hypothetical protein